MDFLCTVENDESEDELYLSSSARDAYARIGMKASFLFFFPALGILMCSFFSTHLI